MPFAGGTVSKATSARSLPSISIKPSSGMASTTPRSRARSRAGRRGDYFEMTPETMFENGPAGLTARLHSGAVDREPPNSCIAGVPRKRQGSARMLSRTKSSKRVGWRAKSCGGGEGVSQPPLKEKAFSTFLDQNPRFELRLKNRASPARRRANAATTMLPPAFRRLAPRIELHPVRLTPA